MSFCNIVGGNTTGVVNIVLLSRTYVDEHADLVYPLVLCFRRLVRVLHVPVPKNVNRVIFHAKMRSILAYEDCDTAETCPAASLRGNTLYANLVHRCILT